MNHGPAGLPLALLFVAFLLTFVITRVITRLIRAGRGPFRNNVSGGVHIHHAVPGIILLIIGAITSVAADGTAPAGEIAAVLIGIGASLVLDEFAMILHMQDVYWSREGQLSVQVVALTVAALGLLLLGLNPVTTDDDESARFGAGHVVMTGDIKVDQTPYDGKPTDIPALSRLGDEGIDLFMCDSTNATIPGISASEAGIEETLTRLVAAGDLERTDGRCRLSPRLVGFRDFFFF